MGKFLVAFAVLAAMNLYVGMRIVRRWPWASAHMPVVLAACFGLFAFELMAPVGDRLWFSSWQKSFANENLISAIDFLSYLALGLIASVFVYVLALDVGTLFLSLSLQKAPTPDYDRRALLTLGVVTATSAAIGVTQAKMGPQVCRKDIPLSRLPRELDGFKIAQISDLHVGPIIDATYVEKVVDIVNGLGADLLALTGDFVDGFVNDIKGDLHALLKLQAPFGKFFVTGNHEYYWDASSWCKAFEEMEFRVLSNEHVMVEKDGASFVLAGVPDYSTKRMMSSEASSPKKAIENAPPEAIKILLAHQPDSYHEASEAGYDLQLSGHTHAGQFFPFSLLIPLFHKYYKGLNRHKDMWIYVNRGTGYWGPPLRTAVPTEITLLTLRSTSV